MGITITEALRKKHEIAESLNRIISLKNLRQIKKLTPEKSIIESVVGTVDWGQTYQPIDTIQTFPLLYIGNETFLGYNGGEPKKFPFKIKIPNKDEKFTNKPFRVYNGKLIIYDKIYIENGQLYTENMSKTQRTEYQKNLDLIKRVGL